MREIFQVEKEYDVRLVALKTISILWYNIELLGGNLAAFLQRIKYHKSGTTYEKKLSAFSLFNEYWKKV